jgi:hypothetical protein
VEDVAPVEFQIPADPALAALFVTPVGANGLPGWPVPLAVSDFDEFLAPEPPPKEGLLLPVPAGVTGRFLRKSQSDLYRFAARKGQKYVVAVQTSECCSPAEVYLTLRDPKGTVVAKSDPQRLTQIELTAGEDGEHSIAAEHINYAFGPTEVYRLTVTQPTAGFDVMLGSDRIEVAQGQAALIPVQTLARRNFAGPIELSVVGPKGLSGSLQVSAGAESGPPPAPGQPTGAPFAMLPVNATGDLPPGVYEITVQAKATIEGKDAIAYASTGTIVSRAMNGLVYPPPTWLRTVAVGVLPKPPFELHARLEPPVAVRGLAATLVVAARRDPGFDGPIQISTSALPSNITAAAQTLSPGQSETRIELKLNERAAMGTYAFRLIGRSTIGELPVLATFLPPPLSVVTPFTLKTEPNPVNIGQGEKAQLIVTATRRGGYTGPIDLELRNLPAQVTASKAAIAEGQTTASLELTAAPAAPLGARGDVDVLGTIGLGQQQAASPAFAVKVQPPTPLLVVKVEPEALSLLPGSKAKIKVTVERKHLAGPVALSISGLPAKVTAPESTLAAEQNVAELELNAAPDAEAAKTQATVTAKSGTTMATKSFAIEVQKSKD